MSNVTLSLILEKIASKDKDFRYMATSDLSNELAKENFQFDSTATEKQVSDVIIKQLEDQSSDISSLANKCLGLLVNKTRDDRLREVVSTLIDGMINGKKEQQRDVASLAMKAIVSELHSKHASVLVHAAAPMLIQGLKSPHNDVIINCLDLLIELTSNYGTLLPNQEALKEALTAELDGRGTIRKRAVQCLAVLAAALPTSSLNSLCELLLDSFEAAGSSADKNRTYVQALAAFSKTIGHKLGPHLTRAVPLCCARLRSSDESDDETKEACLQALEGFVQRVPGESKTHLASITGAALEFFSHDPNYADDMSEDEDAESDQDDEDDSEEDYSDDEDTSWKVRRACAKLASAIIEHYPDLIKDLYRQLAPTLINRFKEREEVVRCDIFGTYADLVRQAGQAGRRGDAAAVAAVAGDVPNVIKAVAKHLKGKSAKTKVAAFKVLHELVGAAPDAVGAKFSELVPGMKGALADKTAAGSSLKIQALQFLNASLASNAPEIFQGSVTALGPAVFSAASDRYYKVSAEALKACEHLVKVIRPSCNDAIDPGLKALVQPLYGLAASRLAAQDQDQEVKEAAINCVAVLVAHLGDELPGESQQVGKLTEDFAAMPRSSRPASKRAKTGSKTSKATALAASPGAECEPMSQTAELLSTLLERMRNDITRLPAVRAFTTIARSPLPIDISSVLTPALQELIALLRKANRSVRQSSLVALDALVARDGARVDPALLQSSVEEVAGLVNDSDLAITSQALQFGVTVLTQQTRVAGAVCDKFLPQAISLLKSPLLQGAAQTSLQTFLSKLAATGTPNASFDALLNTLQEAATEDDAGRSAQHAAARCTAVLCDQAGQDQINATAQGLLSILNDAKSDMNRRRFVLLCLGELGRVSDLTAFPQLQDMVTSALADEGVAEAASLALGGIASGNLSAYLPLLLQHIKAQDSNPKLQYQLLKALNEVITSKAHGSDAAGAMTLAQQQEILQLLLANAQREEECAAIVAECLGHLALLGPDIVLSAMHAGLSSPSADARTVVVSGLRHAAVDREHPIDAVLPSALPAFLEKISDENRRVRKAALQLLNAVAHSKPFLLAGHLEAAVPMVYQQTVINKDLIRVVDLGPFKHQIDDGLELRKAAYECLDTLLDRCVEGIQPGEVGDALLGGLADHYDVKMRCHLLLSKLASIAPGAVATRLDHIVEPLTATLTTKLKSDPVPQEIDRNEDMLRSCLRTVHTLSKVPNAMGVPAFKQFMDSIVMESRNSGMKERYMIIKEGRKELEAAAGDEMDLS